MYKTKRIILWGSGYGCWELLKEYPINLGNIIAIVDCDKCRQGREILGIKVISPEELHNLTFDYIVITIKNDTIADEIRSSYSYDFMSIDKFVEQNARTISWFSIEHNNKDDESAFLTYLHKYLGNKGVYPVAIPDSIYHFNQYVEYEKLKELYTARNTVNQLKDYTRLQSMMLNLNRIMENGVRGEYAELGVYLGNNCAVLHEYCKKHNRKLYMFDTFEGFDDRDLTGIDKDQMMQFVDTSLEGVKAFVGVDEYTRYIKGYFPDSLTDECMEQEFSFVSIDCDLYQPIKAGLEFFYPRLSKGGMIFVHDYSGCFFEGARKAVDEYCSDNELSLVMLPDKAGTAVLTK